MSQLGSHQNNLNQAGMAGPAGHRLLMKPEPYNGDPDTLQGFLTQVRAHFYLNPDFFTDEAVKSLATLGFLTGKPLAWFQPLAQDYLMNKGGDMKEETEQVFDNWETLARKLGELFGNPDEKRVKERGLRQLRQTGSAAAYTTKFYTLASGLQWDDEPLMDRYYAGLKDSVKDELIKIDRPESLATYVEAAIKIDNRNYERKMERQGGFVDKKNPKKSFKKETSTGTHPGPMELDVAGTRSSQASNKKAEWRKQGACLRCGRKGHYVRDCTKKSQEGAKQGTKGLGVVGRKGEHARTHWTFRYDDNCQMYRSSKEGSGWVPQKSRVRLATTRQGKTSNPTRGSLQQQLPHEVTLSIKERAALQDVENLRGEDPENDELQGSSGKDMGAIQIEVEGTEKSWLGELSNPFGVATENKGRPMGLKEGDDAEFSPLEPGHDELHWTMSHYDRCEAHQASKATAAVGDSGNEMTEAVNDHSKKLGRRPRQTRQAKAPRENKILASATKKTKSRTDKCITYMRPYSDKRSMEGDGPHR